jgi:K+-transporting ATPase ATPase B chain
MTRTQLPLLDRKLLVPALIETLKKLDPRLQGRNPVMFVVYVGTIATLVLWVQALLGHGEASTGFIFSIAVWLAFTVLFANLAEALAEGRSRAQASALRNMRQTVLAKQIIDTSLRQRDTRQVKAEDLQKGDIVLVEAGDVIPVDGEVIEGAASVDESAITRDPRIGGRLLLGHRRHPRALRQHRGAGDGEYRRNLSRPHDRDGGRRQAAEDPE